MRRSQGFAIVALFLVWLVQGCNTVSKGAQGATEGFKEDWKKLEEADGWMKEHMW